MARGGRFPPCHFPYDVGLPDYLINAGTPLQALKHFLPSTLMSDIRNEIEYSKDEKLRGAIDKTQRECITGSRDLGNMRSAEMTGKEQGAEFGTILEDTAAGRTGLFG
jgi:hypothetical protein